MRQSTLRLSSLLFPALLLGPLAACGGDDSGDTRSGSASEDGGTGNSGTHHDAGGHDATNGSDGGESDATNGNDANGGGDDGGGRDAKGGSDAPNDAPGQDANDAGVPIPLDGSVKIVVVRVGDGTAALSSASTAVYLDEYAVGANAAPVATTPMPTAASGANAPFTLSGSATSEGALARSSDGHSLVLAGFAAEPGLAAVAKTPSIPSASDAGTDASADGGADAADTDAGDIDAGDTDAGDTDAGDDGGMILPESLFAGDAGDAGPAPSVPRVVATVSAAGAIDTTTLLAAFSGSDVRSAASTDGSVFWVSGAGTRGGVQYGTLGLVGAPTSIVSSPSNARVVAIAAGQLYVGSASSPFAGISLVGTGLPTTASTATLLVPPASASDAGDAGDAAASVTMAPYAFAVLDLDANVAGIDRIYAADDPSTGTGGIQKWTFDGATWTRAAVFAAGLGANQGFLGLATITDGSGVVVVVGTTTETPSRLVAYVDDGSTTSPTPYTLATAAKNTAFRGVALSPQ